jgi:hypothetical protein
MQPPPPSLLDTNSRHEKAPQVALRGLPRRLRVRLADERQVLSGRLAVAAAGEFVLNPLAFGQAPEACPLDGRDVDESISIAVVRLNEAEALRRVEPLHCSGIQNFSPLCKSAGHRAGAPVKSQRWPGECADDAEREAAT